MNDPHSDASDTNEYTHRYGPLARRVVIPRPGSAAEPSDVGKIFLEYKDVESAIKAATEIARRQFNQRVIVVNYINEVDWVCESVSGWVSEWELSWVINMVVQMKPYAYSAAVLSNTWLEMCVRKKLEKLRLSAGHVDWS